MLNVVAFFNYILHVIISFEYIVQKVLPFIYNINWFLYDPISVKYDSHKSNVLKDYKEFIWISRNGYAFVLFC